MPLFVRRLPLAAAAAAVVLTLLGSITGAQQTVLDTRDPAQPQDEEFARLVKEWTTAPHFSSPLVDHLPKVAGVPTPRDVLGHHVGAPARLTYYADALRYYRALEGALPGRVKIETIGRSDEDRELVVVWVSSEENLRGLQKNRENLARIADPRGLTGDAAQALIAATKPHYHLMGGLHSGETGPSEMLMELVYRLATETSPLVRHVRENVIVSVTPVADPDGRDRNVDWFYRNLDLQKAAPAAPSSKEPAAAPAPPAVPYWGKYVYHDNNRDINLSQQSMRALAEWYFTAYPPIMHDLHESLPLLYTYSGAAPQNPNLDPILFAELPWFANFELAQMTKWGMPGVYTHAFMDGWSPGYLGSIAYNHNGMMRMYETQAGREGAPPAAEGGRGSAAASPQGATGRGGGQPREWYRGIPIPTGALSNWSRRNNANYMQTGVLSALQLTASFPSLILDNFYRKTINSIEAGRAEPPYGYVIPPQRDMTRVAALVNILRLQRIEVGLLAGELRTTDGTFASGSYVVKRDQPYGRLARNLLERQSYPDPNLRTYDDSGWTMGLAMLVDVKEVKDRTILDARTKPVGSAAARGSIGGKGAAGLAIAHFGSNNMIALRYRLRGTPMAVADKPFTVGSLEHPAGSLLIRRWDDTPAVRAAIEDLGLTATALSAWPSVPTHAADPPRIAIFSSWTGTQDTGWVRFTFDRFGVPYDVIYKERVTRASLRVDYDVIVMPSQTLNRQAVFQPPAARAVPYMKDAKYKFLGMYGESPDITGGFGGEGVDAFVRFLDEGGTLIAMGNAVRFPTELGLARTVDSSASPSAHFYAPRPLVQAEIVRPEHPIFHGYTDTRIPIKYIQGQPLLGVADTDRGSVLARYVGGDAAVLSGLMRGADEIRERPLAIDLPGGFRGNGRVILFANNPIYRWQNHGEFNMVFNALMNWNDLAAAGGTSRPGL